MKKLRTQTVITYTIAGYFLGRTIIGLIFNL